MPWAKIGETYQVELVQHFETNLENIDDPSLHPYGAYRENEQSCGQGFDLEIGDVVQMDATGPQDKLNNPHCPQCVYINVKTTIGGVSRIFSFDVFSYDVGDPRFADMFMGALDNGCTGQYWVGIMPVEPYFLEHSGEYVATDYMLFRRFAGDAADLCRRPGSRYSAFVLGCWDSWAVRVRDSSGRVLTKDLPRPDASIEAPPDAGLAKQDAG